jgi:probable O-glycosylation ligase (exosortase A-associated)
MMSEHAEALPNPLSGTSSDPSGQSGDEWVPEKLPFSLYVIEAYLCFEYIRPQDIIPGLSLFRLPLILTIILALVVLPRIQEKLADRKVIVFGALLLFMFFHVPVAVNNFWALSILKDMLTLFVVYMAITQVVTTWSRLSHLLTVWLAIHFALALYGLTHGGTGPSAFTADENDLALVLVMAIPMPFFLLFAPKPPVKKPMLLGLLTLYLALVFATRSRGGFLGLLAIALYSLRKTPRKILSVVALAVCVLLASLAAPAEYWDRISTIWGEATGEIDGSGTDRWWTWGVAIEMFLSNPLFGIGQGNFPWTIGEYEGQGFRERSFKGRVAHSVYFTLLPELGVLGVLMFLYMLRLLLRDFRLIRDRASGLSAEPYAEKANLTNVAYALQASLIGFLVAGAFISALYYPPFWLLLAFSTSVQRIARSANPDLAEPVEFTDT